MVILFIGFDASMLKSASRIAFFDLMTLTSCSFMIAPLVYYVCLSACLYEVRGSGIAACLYT